MKGSPLLDREGVPPPSPSVRFHALDGVRVTAMLLGVFYHLPIAFMGGGMGFGMGFGGGTSPKVPIDNWLHSFRMPLFFLVSGFFAAMMLGKYGLTRYLARRWWRIGAPLFLAILAFAGLRYATDPFRGSSPPPFGPPPMPNFGPPPGPPGGFGAPGATPFGPPPGGPGPGVPPGPPAGNPWGAPPGGFGPPPFGGPAAPPGAPGAPTTGIPAGPAVFPRFEMPPMPSRVLADRLFGRASGYFNLEHLWFLWYLLVFATIGPFVALLLARIVAPPWPERFDRLGRGLMRFNLLAPLLGLVAVPALVHARGFAGWSLANPVGFLAPFPDFAFQYYADTPYYFLCFLAGWWLYRMRAGLPDMARVWLWSLALGVAGFAVAQSLSNAYAFRSDASDFPWIRLGGFALYSVGAAYTAFAFLGFFQHYLDRPTPIGRYLADTILWVYLVHLPLIPYVLWWIQPGRGPWWVDTLAGMAVVTGVALVLFELIVRPTPLVHVFGPPNPRRPRPVEDSQCDASSELIPSASSSPWP